MPLLQIYTAQNQLSYMEKLELVSTLTEFYTEIMPDFFLKIVFNEIRSTYPPSCIANYPSYY